MFICVLKHSLDLLGSPPPLFCLLICSYFAIKTHYSDLGLEFEGSPHSGVDDARNIARILVRLLSDRAFVRINEKIVINSTSKADDDNRSAARLANVIPVAR